MGTTKSDETSKTGNRKPYSELLEQMKVKSLFNKYGSEIDSYIENQLIRASKYSATTVKNLMNELAKEIVGLVLESMILQYAKVIDALLAFEFDFTASDKKLAYPIPLWKDKSEQGIDIVNNVIDKLNMLALTTASVNFSSSVSGDKISFQLNLDFRYAEYPLTSVKLIEISIPLTDSGIPKQKLNKLLSVSINPITYSIDRKKLRDELRNNFEQYKSFVNFKVYNGETRFLEILAKYLKWLAEFSQPGLHILRTNDLARLSDIVVEVNDSNKMDKSKILNLISTRFFNYELEPKYNVHNFKTCEHYSKLILLVNYNYNQLEPEKINEIVQSEEYSQLQYLFMYAHGLKVESILRQLKKIGKGVLDWVILI